LLKCVYFVLAPFTTTQQQPYDTLPFHNDYSNSNNNNHYTLANTARIMIPFNMAFKLAIIPKTCANCCAILSIFGVLFLVTKINISNYEDDKKQERRRTSGESSMHAHHTKEQRPHINEWHRVLYYVARKSYGILPHMCTSACYSTVPSEDMHIVIVMHTIR